MQKDKSVKYTLESWDTLDLWVNSIFERNLNITPENVLQRKLLLIQSLSENTQSNKKDSLIGVLICL